MSRNLVVILTVLSTLEAVFFGLAIKYFKINRYLLLVIGVFTLLSYLFFSYEVLNYDRSVGSTHSFFWAVGFLILHFVPKLITIVFWLISALLVLLPSNFIATNDAVQGRKAFLGKLGLAIAAIPFTSILYGIWKGKYNFKVITQQLYFKDLPAAFEGLKVLQISDLHSGSFDNPDKIKYAVDLINEQDFDLCLFTGDIVNTKAEEFLPWVETFKGIKKTIYGKYSVLGNHDYGEYMDWSSEEAKQANFENIKGLHEQIDFKLLCNEHVLLSKDNESIALVGVENWGQKFKKAGDLNKASQGLTDQQFKILMSHDPSHWEYEVKEHSKNYQLTLSGHTHGFQFGIEIPGFLKWSPVQYVYKQWAGLYEHMDRYVYVNRGFGFHAFPGRVGIWPEITVLELKTKKAS